MLLVRRLIYEIYSWKRKDSELGLLPLRRTNDENVCVCMGVYMHVCPIASKPKFRAEKVNFNTKKRESQIFVVHHLLLLLIIIFTFITLVALNPNDNQKRQ